MVGSCSDLYCSKRTVFYPPTYLWRNNVEMLANLSITSKINQQLSEFFKINDTNDIDISTLWCSHKAFSRGLLIQAAACEKRRRGELLSGLLRELKSLEDLNKQHPSPKLENYLFNCRQKVCMSLLSSHQNHSRRVKAQFYVQGNMPGQLLANYISKGERKSNLTSIRDPHTVFFRTSPHKDS